MPSVPAESVAGRGVELELKRRTLDERLVGHPRPAAFGPVHADLVGSAASIGDTLVERLDGEATRRVSGHERVEAPAEAIHLDDVPGLDAGEPHQAKVTSGRGRQRSGRAPSAGSPASSSSERFGTVGIQEGERLGRHFERVGAVRQGVSAPSCFPRSAFCSPIRLDARQNASSDLSSRYPMPDE